MPTGHICKWYTCVCEEAYARNDSRPEICAQTQIGNIEWEKSGTMAYIKSDAFGHEWYSLFTLSNNSSNKSTDSFWLNILQALTPRGGNMPYNYVHIHILRIARSLCVCAVGFDSFVHPTKMAKQIEMAKYTHT